MRTLRHCTHSRPASIAPPPAHPSTKTLPYSQVPWPTSVGFSHARVAMLCSQSFHEEEEDPEKAAMEHDEMRKRFNGLDANGDGHIDVEELRAELHSLHPSEAVFAQRQAAHLVEQADEDKDLHLTLDEMLANPVRILSTYLPHS